jgi:non-specific serine/threonine protein kinase
MILSDAVPLLTLTGPGGVGKTRLALQLVAELGDQFVDGISFVSLAAIRDPDLVAPTLALAVGVPETGARSPLEGLRASLQEKELLLVLDNFEHVVEAAPLVAELLTSCPRLKFLVTSRTVLRLRDEHESSVPPLSIPDLSHLPSLADLAQYEGIALFVQRAAAANPGFALTEANASAIAEICARLDGLPLAIELAAARCRLLTPSALLARLTNRLLVLTGGARDQPVRLRTMRDAVAWSYDLLSPPEQTLFRRLAVFVGSFSLAAAEYLGRSDAEVATGLGPNHSAPDSTVLDLIGALVEQSLLMQPEHADGELRFSMLQTIREFALEQLRLGGHEEDVRERHAAWSVTMAEEADIAVRGRAQIAWLARLESDHDNLRSALSWSLECGNPMVALRLAGALHWFWFQRGHWVEGRQWLERSLAEAGDCAPISDRARAMAGLGLLTFVLSDYPTSRACLEACISLCREADHEQGLAYATLYLAWPMLVQGHYQRVRELASESLARFRALGDRWGSVAALCSLGSAEMDLQAEQNVARSLLERGLAEATEIGDAWSIARAANCLGEIARGEGDLERAEALYTQALALMRELGPSKHASLVLHNLGQVALLRGDAPRGASLFADALRLQTNLGDRRGQSLTLSGLAALAASTQSAERAARLFGAADTLVASAGVVVESLDLDATARHRIATRARLGESAYVAAWEAGAALPLPQAIAEGLALAQFIADEKPSNTVSGDSSPSPYGLSHREQDVLRLIVEGHSNQQIADALFISHKTVRNRVSIILSKLGVESRTAAATLALRNGLV